MSYWYQEFPTGSTYIVGSGADKDILRFVEEASAEAARAQLESEGWEAAQGGNYTDLGGSDGWLSLRRGDDNMLLIWDPLMYVRFVAFSALAKDIQLDQKVQRVELSKALVDGCPVAAMNILRTSEFNTYAGFVTSTYKVGSHD